MDKITTDTLASATEVALCLGITARRVQQLVQDGILYKKEGNKLNLSDSIQRYIEFLRKDITQLDEDEAKAERTKKNADASIKVSKAKIAQLQAKELEGKMHRAEDIETLTEDLIFSFRSALIALPGRLAIDVAAVDTAAEASEVIRKEIHKVMGELAIYRYDPTRYDELVRNRMSWNTEREEDE